MKTDWREILAQELTFKQLRRLIWLPLVLLFATFCITHYGSKTKTKYIGSKTTTVIQAAPKVIHRTIHTPPEPRIRDCIGCMTAQEFASIHADETFDDLAALFGEPQGNVDNDRKEFYPAVGGGVYWVYLKWGGQCNKNHDNTDCVDVVASKSFKP